MVVCWLVELAVLPVVALAEEELALEEPFGPDDAEPVPLVAELLEAVV